MAPERHPRAHDVHLVHFDRAHVYGVSATRHPKARAKVERHGEIVETIPVANLYAAIALKHQVLDRVDKHRCIAPRSMVPTGRTETWHEAGGLPLGGLRAPLRVSVIRFDGLNRFRQIRDALNHLNNVEAMTYLGHSTEDACDALTQPTDVAILTSHGYDPDTWGSPRRPWPGGRWYAGGRGLTAPGITLRDLVAGVGRSGGLQATQALIIDACALESRYVRSQLRMLTAETPTELVTRRSHGGGWDLDLRDLVTLTTHLEGTRDIHTAATSSERYELHRSHARPSAK